MSFCLQVENPGLLSDLQLTPLTCWLHSLDNFNRLAPGLERNDTDDLLWPGVNKYGSRLGQQDHPQNGGSGGIMTSGGTGSGDVPSVRKADLENHNKDGGHWMVLKGKVYDVQDFR